MDASAQATATATAMSRTVRIEIENSTRAPLLAPVPVVASAGRPLPDRCAGGRSFVVAPDIRQSLSSVRSRRGSSAAGGRVVVTRIA